MRKFLVVNMNYMGDALLTTPALAALRQANPGAQIDTVVGAGAAAKVLEASSDLDKIIPRTAPGSWARCMQIYRLLREGQYTDAIILPPLPAYAAAAFFARTPNRIGQAGRGMNRFLTELRPTRATHMAEAMLDTMPGSAYSSGGRRRLYVTVGRDAMEDAERLLIAAGIDLERPLLAINVGATRPQKRWFAEFFAATLDLLPDVQCVLVGAGEHDVTLAAEIRQRSRKNCPKDLIGQTDVKQLAAVLSYADVVLSADSGPMHLATAVGTPTVALFGSTDPAATGPFDGVSRVLYKALPCAPCGNHPTCDGRYDCLRAITPEETALAVRDLLRERRMISALPLIVNAPAAEASVAPRPAEPEIVPSRTSADSREIRRILIATKFRFIGDSLLAIPIFRAARAQWPDAHIALLTGRNARLLLQNNPYLDEIIEFDPYRQDKGVRADMRLVRRLRQNRFDLCLSLNRSFHSALIPWLGRAQVRAGFLSEGRGWFLNRRVAYDRDKSEVACYFDVLRSVAPDAPIVPTLELWISEPERQFAESELSKALGGELSQTPLIGIQPGASIPGKRWPVDRFAQVADLLLSEEPTSRLVVVGGPDETEEAKAMLKACSAETRQRAVNCTGAYDLRGSLAIVSHLSLFIGNDTAVMHSAVALDVPTVALFGPTNPRKWGNYGASHRVLESKNGQMGSIKVSEVADAALSLRRLAVGDRLRPVGTSGIMSSEQCR